MPERRTDISGSAAEEQSFLYTYSAPQQQEVKQIREKYIPVRRPSWSSCAGWMKALQRRGWLWP